MQQFGIKLNWNLELKMTNKKLLIDKKDSVVDIGGIFLNSVSTKTEKKYIKLRAEVKEKHIFCDKSLNW